MTKKLTDLTRSLNLTFGARRHSPRWPGPHHTHALPRAFLMTDSRRFTDPEPIIDVLPQDVAIVFRHYSHPDRLTMAERLVHMARRQGIRVLIAGDIRLAQHTGADGVHLPGHMLSSRRGSGAALARPDWLVTAAVHNRRELLAATLWPADAIFISPVFTTPSHAARRALGLAGLQGLVRRSRLPAFALGGINEQTVARLKHAGIAGCAGIGLFSAAYEQLGRDSVGI